MSLAWTWRRINRIHSNFFNRVFGGETRKDVAEHAEIIDNTVYMCGGLGADAMDTRIVLNRLLDPEKVSRILINGIGYSSAE